MTTKVALCQVDSPHFPHMWCDLDSYPQEQFECFGLGTVVRDPEPVDVSLALGTLDVDARGIEYANEQLAAIHEDGRRRWYTSHEVKSLFHQNRRDGFSHSWWGVTIYGVQLYERPVGMSLQLRWPRVGDFVTVFDRRTAQIKSNVVTWSGWGTGGPSRSGGHAIRVRGVSGPVYANHIMEAHLTAAEVVVRAEQLSQERLLRVAADALQEERYRVLSETRELIRTQLPPWLRKGQPITWTDREPSGEAWERTQRHEVRLEARALRQIAQGQHHAIIRKVDVDIRLDVILHVEDVVPAPFPFSEMGPVVWDVDLREMLELTPLPRSKAEAQRWALQPPVGLPAKLATLPPAFMLDP